MLRIYGHSDDCIEIEGDVREEIYANDDEAVLLVGRDDAGVVVTVTYAPRLGVGVWRVGFEPIDEEVPIPWPVRVELEPEKGYSAVGVIECPPGTLVRKAREDGGWMRLEDSEEDGDD